MSVYPKICREYESTMLTGDIGEIPAIVVVRQPRTSSSCKSRVSSGDDDISPNSSFTSSATNILKSGSSKPWKVDLAKKTNDRERFARRQRRLNSLVLHETNVPHLTCVRHASNSSFNELDSPEMDGSWIKKSNDEGYPSDEENGFGGSSKSNNISFRSTGSQSPTPLDRSGDSDLSRGFRSLSVRYSRY